MSSLASRLAALVLLIALSPLLLVLGLACLASQGSPVLFRQKRAGKDCETFELLKFRTMRDAYNEAGEPLPDEMRVTLIGRFLRRSRLDELPGLVNVARGEMAFVGPRPLLPHTIEDLGARGRERCTVKPGLTGWSQVNGNTLLSLDQKVELDLWYIRNRRPSLDAKILLRTVLVMIGGEKLRIGTA
jgi:lipopolysaccharide/colanic/teichoic acid biosynthesis glycosyltransferase